MRVTFINLCLCFIKLIGLASSSVCLSTTATYLSSCSFMYLRLPYYCHACLSILLCAFQFRCYTILKTKFTWNSGEELIYYHGPRDVVFLSKKIRRACYGKWLRLLLTSKHLLILELTFEMFTFLLWAAKILMSVISNVPASLILTPSLTFLNFDLKRGRATKTIEILNNHKFLSGRQNDIRLRFHWSWAYKFLFRAIRAVRLSSFVISPAVRCKTMQQTKRSSTVDGSWKAGHLSLLSITPKEKTEICDDKKFTNVHIFPFQMCFCVVHWLIQTTFKPNSTPRHNARGHVLETWYSMMLWNCSSDEF